MRGIRLGDSVRKVIDPAEEKSALGNVCEKCFQVDLRCIEHEHRDWSEEACVYRSKIWIRGEDIILGVVHKMIHGQVDPASMHSMRGHPLDCDILLFFSEGFEAFAHATTPVAVFLMDFFDFGTRFRTNSVNGFEHPSFDRPDLTAAFRNVSLNEVVEFAFGPQTELNKLFEPLSIVLRNQEFEIRGGFQNRSIESVDDFRSIFRGAELRNNKHEFRNPNHQTTADSLIPGPAAFCGRFVIEKVRRKTYNAQRFFVEFEHKLV